MEAMTRHLAASLMRLEFLFLAGVGIALATPSGPGVLGQPPRDLGASSSETDRADSARSRTPSEEQASKPPTSLREGFELIRVEGRFDLTGDGITFIDNAGNTFGALRNLNLQRIARTLREENKVKKVNWSITGLITEYEGKHYVLIRRAIQKNSTIPPREIRKTTPDAADDQLEQSPDQTTGGP